MSSPFAFCPFGMLSSVFGRCQAERGKPGKTSDKWVLDLLELYSRKHAKKWMKSACIFFVVFEIRCVSPFNRRF